MYKEFGQTEISHGFPAEVDTRPFRMQKTTEEAPMKWEATRVRRSSAFVRRNWSTLTWSNLECSASASCWIAAILALCQILTSWLPFWTWLAPNAYSRVGSVSLSFQRSILYRANFPGGSCGRSCCHLPGMRHVREPMQSRRLA